MKIVFCAYDSPGFVSGPNSWLRRILPELRRRGAEVTVLFIKERGDCPTLLALDADGFECFELEGEPYTERRVKWILERVAEIGPQVFVANVVTAAYYAGRWVRDLGIATVGVLHSDFPFYHAIYEEFASGPARLSGVVAVSRRLEQFVKERGCSQVGARRIAYGIPLPEHTADFRSRPFRLVYLGRLEEKQKRISEVTFGLCETSRQLPHTEAVIFGAGAAKPQVARIIAEHAPTQVTLAEPIDVRQVPAELLAAQAFVLLSDYEGLPISLMEAMASGVVPICLKGCSGVEELVEDRRTGLLVEDRQQALVEAVRELSRNADLWNRLSRSAREKIEAEYSLDHAAEEWMDFFRSQDGSNSKLEQTCMPSQIRLPSVIPEFASDDTRLPPFYYRAARKLWHPLKRAFGREQRRC